MLWAANFLTGKHVTGLLMVSLSAVRSLFFHLCSALIHVDKGTILSNSSAIAITEYAGPAPALGSGPHRYAINSQSYFHTQEILQICSIGVLAAFDFQGTYGVFTGKYGCIDFRL